MNDFRKTIFKNSQYCNYYIDNDSTVFAGVMRNWGYKYETKFSEETKAQMNEVYRNFTTLMNCIVGAEILLYLYLFVFPYYLKLLELPFFVFGFVLSAIPLVMLYLTYIAVNYLYETSLQKKLGEFNKVKFLPTIYNVEPEAYAAYKKTSKKSVYVMALVMGAFLYFVFTPIVVGNFVTAGKYQAVLKTANLYTKLVPIFPDVYAQRAYANFKLGKYEDAVKDFELANSYSRSHVFDWDILGVKTCYLPFKDVVNAFDAAIVRRDKNIEKQFLMAEKADYLMKNKKYHQALAIYDELIMTYRKREEVAFAPDEVYFNRGVAKSLVGDVRGAAVDKAVAKKMCSVCEYDFETKLVRKP